MSAASTSSLLILHPRLKLKHLLKPLFVSVSKPCSSSSFPLNPARRFFITKPPLSPTISRKHSSVASAESPSDNGRGAGGRTGALSPPQFVEDLQKIDVNPPKGTRDFPPDEMRLRNWLFHNFREVAGVSPSFKLSLWCLSCSVLIGCGWCWILLFQVSRLFGFEEVDFPVLESEALFVRKAGEEIRDQVSFFSVNSVRYLCVCIHELKALQFVWLSYWKLELNLNHTNHHRKYLDWVNSLSFCSYIVLRIVETVASHWGLNLLLLWRGWWYRKGN